jgi:hypothetical protein
MKKTGQISSVAILQKEHTVYEAVMAVDYLT